MSKFDGELKRKMVLTIIQFLCEVDPNLILQKDSENNSELYDSDGNWSFRVADLAEKLIEDVVS